MENTFPTIEELLEKVVELPTGQKCLVTTPHPVNFYWADDPEGRNLFVAEGSGWLVNARPVEQEVGECGHATLLKTGFVGDERTRNLLEALKASEPQLLIVGSIIAAQAYPGLVYGLVPAPGFERVPPAEKRMSMTRFNTW